MAIILFMNNLLDKLVGYVSAMTGAPAAWDALVQRDLPPFLRKAYDLAEVAIGDQWLLAVIPRDGHVIQPAAFEKHVARLRTFALRGEAAEYCLVAAEIPAYVRKRLVERRIPFVVPGKEMFLPQLGQAVRARRHHAPLKLVEQFTPATQMAFLLALTEPDFFPARPLDVADRLGMATMTVTRAFNDLELTGMGKAVRKGHERWLEFNVQPQVLWQKALPYLRDPVRTTRRIHIAVLPEVARIKAGETALAAWTQLLAPPEPVFAMASRDWKHLAANVEEIPVPEPDTCIVQLWRYDPKPLAKNGRVDRFSLWLSLEKERDERVQAARETLMEEST